MAQKVNRINAKDLETGIKVEMAEHPGIKRAVAARLAGDHLQRDRNAYKEGDTGGRVIVILNQNVKAVPPRKKPRPQVQQQQVVDDKPSWLPDAMRRPF